MRGLQRGIRQSNDRRSKKRGQKSAAENAIIRAVLGRDPDLVEAIQERFEQDQKAKADRPLKRMFNP